VKLSMDKRTGGLECKEVLILTESKVLLKHLFPSLSKLFKEMNNTRNCLITSIVTEIQSLMELSKTNLLMIEEESDLSENFYK